MTEYYEREALTHLDGTKIFQSTADREAERAVADEVEAFFDCKVRHFGALCGIDWYAIKNDRMVAVLELKIRAHTRDKFPTVWLSCRKYMALTDAGRAFGTHGMFVVKFSDGTFYVPIRRIDATRHRMGGVGKARAMQSDSDVEPVIDVPVENLLPLRREAQ